MFAFFCKFSQEMTIKELSIRPKLKYSNLYIFATWCWKSLIFKIKNSAWLFDLCWNNQCLHGQMFTRSDVYTVRCLHGQMFTRSDYRLQSQLRPWINQDERYVRFLQFEFKILCWSIFRQFLSLQRCLTKNLSDDTHLQT